MKFYFQILRQSLHVLLLTNLFSEKSSLFLVTLKKIKSNKICSKTDILFMPMQQFIAYSISGAAVRFFVFHLATCSDPVSAAPQQSGTLATSCRASEAS